jgi:hypothetical protein
MNTRYCRLENQKRIQGHLFIDLGAFKALPKLFVFWSTFKDIWVLLEKNWFIQLRLIKDNYFLYLWDWAKIKFDNSITILTRITAQTDNWEVFFFLLHQVFVTLRCCRSPSVRDEDTLETVVFPKFLFCLTVSKNIALSLLFLAAAWECSSA